MHAIIHLTMDLQKSFNLLFAMQFMAMVLALPDLHKMSSEDYVNYINPPAVHKYQHENGDTILCVNYEDQISLNPDKTYKKDLRKNWMGGNLSSSLNKECPEGTIHVRKIKHEDVKRAGSVARLISIKSDIDDSYDTKYAMASLIFGQGGIEKATGVMDVWQPYVDASALRSSTFIRVGVEQDEEPSQMIEAGWQVYEGLYGSPTPRFFVRWLGGDNNNEGCFDLNCVGFVKAKTASLYAGQPVTPQTEVNISIQYETRNPAAWVVYVNSTEVGYLPANLVSDILPNINTVKWGGEVLVKKGTTSRTDMGNGRYPKTSKQDAAYIRNMDRFVAGGARFYGGSIKLMQNSQNCYRVGNGGAPSSWGDYILYGGPGTDDPQCKA